METNEACIRDTDTCDDEHMVVHAGNGLLAGLRRLGLGLFCKAWKWGNEIVRMPKASMRSRYFQLTRAGP